MAKAKTKIKWRPILTDALNGLYLPKPIPRVPGTPLFVFVSLRFGPRSQSPETPNYEPSVKECVLDVLRVSEDPSAQGWIDDDKDDQVWIAVDIMKERGKRGMMVVLEWMEPVDETTPRPFFEPPDIDQSSVLG